MHEKLPKTNLYLQTRQAQKVLKENEANLVVMGRGRGQVMTRRNATGHARPRGGGRDSGRVGGYPLGQRLPKKVFDQIFISNKLFFEQKFF
jgi:hypothetical protein